MRIRRVCRFAFYGRVLLMPFLLLAAADAAEPKKTEEPMINYRDIPEHVQIIGKLGYPLGNLVTVRGQWKSVVRAKPTKPLFFVNWVNGKLLDPPAEFARVHAVSGPDTDVTRKEGEVWELRGVESGGIEGFSEKVWSEVEANEPPAAHTAFGFVTNFYYATARRIPR